MCNKSARLGQTIAGDDMLWRELLGSMAAVVQPNPTPSRRIAQANTSTWVRGKPSTTRRVAGFAVFGATVLTVSSPALRAGPALSAEPPVEPAADSKNHMHLAQTSIGTSVESPPKGEAVARDAGPAHHQDAVATLTEVVVTAERRRERLKDVPISVTALSGGQLQSLGVASGADLQNYVPSLNVSSAVTRNDYIYVIRGMGPTAGLSTGAGGGTGVVTYFADVPVPAAGPGLFYDLESVQVAKGPQGTLFGKNTTGGIVLFVPKRPEDRFDGSIELDGGDFGMRAVTAVLNAPVAGHALLVRFAA